MNELAHAINERCSMTNHEPPTIAERYASASTSSNLRCEADIRGDLDTIIAAGWSGKTEGCILSRCRNEFDDAHASIPADIGATNRRMLTMMRIATLPSAKAVVREWAQVRAIKFALDITDDGLRNLSWTALSVWLDPNCPSCSGRGFSGGYDGPTLRCGHCHESGKRRGYAGNSDAQRAFVEAIICRIESEVSAFQVETQGRLRGY